MVYISGTQNDFSTRLHAQIQSSGDLTGVLPSLQVESGNYTGAPQALQNQWVREINKKLFIYSGIPSLNG